MLWASLSTGMGYTESMAKKSSLERIDFIPLAGLSNLEEASRVFGEIMQEEAGQTTQGEQEHPGRLQSTQLVHDGILVSSPAWRGVQWVDEGENQQAIDTISDTLVRRFPALSFILSIRESATEGGQFLARAHFRWPGAMGLEESLGLTISGTHAPMSRPNHKGKQELIPAEQADLEKILGGCLAQVPQAKEYFQSHQTAETMDEKLPEASRVGLSSPGKPRF